MHTLALYVRRNWYYGLSIVAAFFVLNQFGPAAFRLGLYVWAFIVSLIFGVGFFVWRNARRDNALYIRKEVLDTIVHEFQTPISSIKMAVDILVTPFGKSSPERTEKYIHIIREETERLQLQVDVMLSLARADRGRLTLSLDSVDLHGLIESVAERHGTYLTLNLAPEQPVLLADRLHLTNVLHNLIDNGIKYSLAEPELSVYTLSDAQGLTMGVVDRGMGIPKHLQQKIFQPFYRVSDQQVSVKGFGLGLSYVQRVINAHNWQLELKSEVNKGSEFKIRFPQAALVSGGAVSHL